jgi:hypothetical protein
MIFIPPFFLSDDGRGEAEPSPRIEVGREDALLSRRVQGSLPKGTRGRKFRKDPSVSSLNQGNGKKVGDGVPWSARAGNLPASPRNAAETKWRASCRFDREARGFQFSEGFEESVRLD